MQFALSSSATSASACSSSSRLFSMGIFSISIEEGSTIFSSNLIGSLEDSSNVALPSISLTWEVCEVTSSAFMIHSIILVGLPIGFDGVFTTFLYSISHFGSSVIDGSALNIPSSML
jgi:hypothetical protein